MTPSPLAVVMVGLPARGKSFIAQKIARYLAWLGYPTRVFNAGDYRRQRLGAFQPHGFFDPDNSSGRASRRELALLALDDMLDFIRITGGVGVHDATNTTQERRRDIHERCRAAGVPVLFVESQCTDQELIERNIQSKLNTPDYSGVAPEEAVADFRVRVAHYQRAYTPILQGEEGASIKLVDVGERIVLKRIEGYLPSRLVYFLLNTHIEPRPIWLTRHGESEYNTRGLLGGDAPLSPLGWEYAQNLGRFMESRCTGEQPLRVLTSTLRRARQTASTLACPSQPFKELDEIDAGICDGLTYAQVAQRYPDEYVARKADKLRYRYPRGESYQDVIQRIDKIILELERERGPVLVVAHNAILRTLYGYFVGTPLDELPHLPMPLHTVIELVPGVRCLERRHPLGPERPA